MCVLLYKQVPITKERCRNDETQKFIKETHNMKRKPLINLISYKRGVFFKDFIFNCVNMCA